MYTILMNGEKKHFENFPNNTYFAMGLNGSVEGQAYLCHWDEGTCLSPLFNDKGEIIVIAENAGKTLRSGILTN